jgi:predicted outer membrane repeat protein
LSGNKTRVRDISIYDCVFTEAWFEGETSFGYIAIMLYLYINITIEKCAFLPRITKSAILIRPAITYSSAFIRIDKCLFMGPNYGAVRISYANQQSLNITIINSMFKNISTTALAVTKGSPDPNDQLSILIENTTFIHNDLCSLYASQINNITLTRNRFIENDYTPIMCEGSRIYFSGSTYMVGNKGYDGGALSLSAAIFLRRFSNNLIWEASPPILYLHPGARLILKNNKASNKGGAIYVDTSSLYNDLNRYNVGGKVYYEPCFYQLTMYGKLLKRRQNKFFISHDIVPKLLFINNTAGFAGHSIFGGLYEDCNFQTPLKNRIRFKDLINISHQLSPSEMAGDPNMICLCVESVVDCNERVLYISTYQSQSIQIYAIAARLKNHYANYGATPAVINIQIDEDARVGKGQSAHKLDNKCSEILFSIYTTEQFVEVTISLSGEALSAGHLFIQVTLLGCPFGFQLEDSMYPGCTCDTVVKESGCNCSIDNLAISCPFGKWIGNKSNKTIVHHHCPFDYCIPESHIRVTQALDNQCQHNRSGILCGGCQPGFSLVLGNSKCADCSSVPLLLIVVFALAGLALVLLLYGCNLTVSRGTVNGLIYFSNVVQVNGSIFVTQNTPQFFVVFVSWVNLDLGIQTCFYNGMDMYAKAWLQFVFPVYMWLIVAIIVVLSRHSVTISRLTRDNTVPVLATLFLLSYAKLLRTINTSFSFTYLRYPDGTHTPVWMHDGNVPFAKGKHIALFIAALVAMIGFIIPYTLLLLLSPCLQRWSHNKPLGWVNKLKPFLDANHGPYKNKMRNWTGIILLIRAVQFTCFAANSEGDPNINLMVILLIGVAPYLVVWIFGTVYKSKANSILESAFVLLLSILASASLYIRTTSLDVEGKQTAITMSIFAAAFFLFLNIVAYHLFKFIKSTISKLTKRRKFLPTFMPDTPATEVSSERASDQKFTAPSVSYVALSELTPQSDN